MLFIKQQLNEIISEYTDIRVTSMSPSLITLSNGVELDDPVEIRKFKRRILNWGIEYLKRFEMIYSGDLTLSMQGLHDAKRANSQKGGKRVQEKHGDKIKQRLNTGTPWNKGKKGVQVSWSKGLTKHDDSRILEHRSQARIGELNPMYGKTLSTEHREKIAKAMTQKIRAGEFTPNTNNRNTHWQSSFNGKKYRSSWEALCQYCFPEAEYESLRIPYSIDGQERTYIVDFVDHQKKLVIEVKPIEFQTGTVYNAKTKAAIEWCNQYGYSFQLFDQNNVRETQITESDLLKFDENTIRKILEEQKRQ